MGGSGWERMFELVKIHSHGVAITLLRGKKVKKTRNAYLVTLAWLEVLRNQGYEAHCRGYGPHISIEMWEENLFSSSPTANYWGKVVRDFLIKYCCFFRRSR